MEDDVITLLLRLELRLGHCLVDELVDVLSMARLFFALSSLLLS